MLLVVSIVGSRFEGSSGRQSSFETYWYERLVLVVEKAAAISIELRIDILNNKLLGGERIVVGVKTILLKGRSLILLGKCRNWLIALGNILPYLQKLKVE